MALNSERNAQEAEDYQQDRSRKAGKGADDHRYPVIPDIGFSGILHQVKEIDDEKGDQTNDCVYHQVFDVLNDEECDREE